MHRLVAMATKDETKVIIPTLRNVVMQKCNELGYCPFCSSPIADIVVTYTDETAREAISKVVEWCERVGTHEFTTSDIGDLLTHTQYANLNHLTAFGGIVYRPKNPKTGLAYKSKFYGINLMRAHEFLSGARTIPIQIKRNRFTRERTDQSDGTVTNLPPVAQFTDEDGQYHAPTEITKPYKDD